jgi:O-antigen/teichoic acid export membrane protein
MSIDHAHSPSTPVAASRRSTVFANLFQTFGATAAVTVALIVATRLFAQGLGPEMFGLYSISKRVIGLVFTVVNLGAGVAAVREIAIAQTPMTRARAEFYALLIGVCPALALIPFSVLSAPYIAETLFQSPGQLSLVVACAVSVFGMTLYTAYSATLLGTLRVGAANILSLVGQGLVPLLIAAAFLPRWGVIEIVWVSGLAVLCLGLPAVVGGLRAFRLIEQQRGQESLWTGFPAFWRSSFPRMPANFAFAGLLWAPTLFASFAVSLREAGYLVAGQSVISLMDGSLIAFSRVMLPTISRQLAEGRHAALQVRIESLAEMTIHVGLFIGAQILVWSDELIVILLGPQYVDAVSAMRLVAIGTPFYFAYLMLRSVIDAAQNSAANMRNLFVALAVCVAGCICTVTTNLGLLGLSASLSAGLCTLGVLSARSLSATWRLPRISRASGAVIGAAAALSAAAWLAKTSILPLTASTVGDRLAVAGSLLVLSCAGYAAVLWRARVLWVRDVLRNLPSRRRQQ